MRRRRATKRKSSVDPVHKSELVAKMVNHIMWDGKKGVAERVLYGALQIVEEKTKKASLEVLEKAIQNITPVLEVRSRRVGGANYQVPVEVRPSRKRALAIRWMVTYARERGGKTMTDKLANEIMAAANNEGGAVKKKEDIHRMAEANKAFAHFRW